MASEIIRHPIVLDKSKNKREPKTTKAQSLSRLLDARLMAQLKQHRPALYFTKDKRDFIPTLVEVVQCFKYTVLVRYKCYDPSGNFRQYLYTSISYVDLYIGECKLKFFEDDI